MTRFLWYQAGCPMQVQPLFPSFFSWLPHAPAHLALALVVSPLAIP